jgi:hypothetical protein
LQAGEYEQPGPPDRPAPLPVFPYRSSRCQSSPAATACASPAVFRPLWTPSTIIVIIIWPPPAGRSSSAPAQPIAGPSPFCALGRLLWRVRVSLHTASATQPAPHPQPAPNLTYILRGSFNHHHPTSPSILRGDLLRSNDRERERERERDLAQTCARERAFVCLQRPSRTTPAPDCEGESAHTPIPRLRSTRDARKGAAAAKGGSVHDCK